MAQTWQRLAEEQDHATDLWQDKDSTSVRSADQEWQTLPVTSNEKGTLSIARRRTR